MKFVSSFLLFLCLICSSTVSVYAMDENMFSKSHAIYMKGIDGSESDLEKAIEYFDKLSVSAPFDIFVNTYRGSLRSRMAQHVLMPWSKMKHVDAGSELMDNAIDDISEVHDSQTIGGTTLSFRMKLTAAHTYFRFPRFLNRYQDAKDLVADLLESPNLETTSQEAKNNLYGLAAEIAEEDGDEQKKAAFQAKII